MFAPGPLADHQTVTLQIESPNSGQTELGLIVARETFAYSSPPDDDYIIFKYTVFNPGSTTLSGLHIGQILDLDLALVPDTTASFGDDIVEFDTGDEVARVTSNSPELVAGHVLLTDAVTSYRPWGIPSSREDPATGDNATWFLFLSGGIVDAGAFGPSDIRHLLSHGPVSIAPGGSRVVAFALIGGDDLEDLAANVAAARAKWATLPQDPYPIGAIHVTVQDAEGTPAAGRVVTVVNNVLGPFRQDGSVTMDLTGADGVATISGLQVPGNYCVHVRPLTSIASATGSGDLVVPDPSPPTQAEDEAGAITGADLTSVAFTNPNYVQFCVQTPPISLDVNNSQVNVTLQLQAGVSVEVQVTDLNGETQALPAWAVMDKTGEIPWCPPEIQALGINCGILLSTTPNSGATLTGLPPASQVAVEILGEVAGQGFLAFSNPQVTTPQTGQPPVVLQVQSEPLLCSLNVKNEREDDASPGKINFLDPVKDGFRGELANAVITATDEVTVFYDQTGNGNAQLHMRFRMASTDALNLVARYSCQNGACTQGTQSGEALSAGIMAEAFFSPQNNGGGIARVTWVVSGLPASLTGVEYRLSSSGDDFPDPPRPNQQAGFSPIPIPTTCDADQSNDDEWWIGG